jgi:hypothetical protein
MSFKNRLEETALQTLARLQVVYGPEPHEYRAATLDEFPQLDRTFYDRMQIWFESCGFRYLGDCDNVTLSRVYPEKRTLIRRMVGKDDTVCVAIYHIRTTGRRFFRVHRIIDLETEFSDATFMRTSNVADAARLSPVPGIDHLNLASDIEPRLLLLAHMDRMSQKHSSIPSTTTTAVRTIEEAYAFQQRMHAIAAKARREAGYITREEFSNIKGRSLSENEERLVEQIEQIKAAQSERGQ